MRRCFLYLSVMLFAFGIGTLAFVLLRFYKSEYIVRKTGEVANILQIKFVAMPENSEPPVGIPTEIRDDSEICSGLDSGDYHEPAIKKWLKGQKIEEKTMRPPKDYIKDGDEFIPSLIDVNQDGTKELLIKSYCSPLKNCSFYIYQKAGKSYRQIFFTYHPGQSVNFSKASGNPYRTLTLITKLSERAGFYSIYKYNGQFYDTTNCFRFERNKKGQETRAPIKCFMVESDEP